MIVQYGQQQQANQTRHNMRAPGDHRHMEVGRGRMHTHSMATKRSALSPLCSACRLCSPTKKKKTNAEKSRGERRLHDANKWEKEKDGWWYDNNMEVRWGEALSRDRNLAHSFPCQKGHHRTKSRAGPPTILDSRFLRWKASTYQRKGEEACRRSKNHKEIKLLQPNEPSTSCSLSPVTVRASLTTLFFKEIFYFFKKKIIFFWKIGIPWKIEKKTQVQTDETSKYLHGLVFSGNCCHSKPRRHALTNVRRTTWVVRKKEPVP
jgi:hypothetical protein